MGIFEEAAIFRGVTKEDARQMLNCLNPVEKTYKKDEIIYHAGDEDYSGEYGLMSGDRIDRDLIDMIPHYKESPLVQKAINDMEKYLNEKHGKVQEAEQTVEVKQKVSETPFKKESVSVESNREQNKEPAKGGKGELKKSVLQSLKEFQARAKAQEQKEMATEKSKAHKKGNVEL